MADRSVDVLLVGGGPASVACARELRDRGFTGSVLIAGRELDAPYDRPPCSKEYLRAPEAGRASLALDLPDDVEVLTRAAVMKLDPEAKVAKVAKEEVAYGQALIATGANVRRLSVEGGHLDGIHYIRAPGNSEAIHADLLEHVPEGGDVVVVGGSFLGTEVAASLTQLGRRVTILMQEDEPMALSFGATAGRWYRALLEDHGVTVIGGDALGSFEGGERVETVLSTSGRRLPAGLVVIAAGAVPEVMLAKGSGLEIGETGGIRCDPELRTSAPDVFAAGDACEYDCVLHGARVRVEHWDHAEAQGRTVARAMLGEGGAHEEVPYFWSDLADWGSVEYVGVVHRGFASEVVRGDVEGHAFTVWLLGEDGRLLGAFTVGRGDDLDVARRLIAARTPVDAASLPG